MSTETSTGDMPDDELTPILARERSREVVDVEVARVQVVVCRIGGDAFAFPGAQVAEILPLAPIYPVPGCPLAVVGVIDVRGRICSVLELGTLLGYPLAPLAPQSRHTAIVLGRATNMESGLRVERVEDVLEVAEEAILPPPANLSERLHGLVSGVFTTASGPVLMLDLARLFAAWREGRL